MGFTIYGILLFIYIISVIIKFRNIKRVFVELFILAIFLYLNITIGYVVKIGDQTIAGYFLAMLFSAIFGILCIRKMELKRFVIFFLFIILMSVSLIIASSANYQVVAGDNGWDQYLFGQNNIEAYKVTFTNVKEFIKAISFVIIIEVIYQVVDNDAWRYIVYKVIKYSKVILCYDLFEFIMVYIFRIKNLYAIFLQPIFGRKASTFMSAKSRGKGFQLQGLFTEPSAYATGLFVLILLFLIQMRLERDLNKYNSNNTKYWIILCIFLMTFSMSFTSILYLMTLTVFFVLNVYKTKPQFRKILAIIIISIIGCFTLGIFLLIKTNSYYGQRMLDALVIIKQTIISDDLNNLYFQVFNYANDGSTISRLGSAIGIIKLEFIQNPILGLGVGTANSHAVIPNMLTDLGIVGTVLWYKLLFPKKSNIYTKITLFTMLITGCFTSPFNYLGADVIVLSFIIERLYGGEQSIAIK